MTSLSLSKRPLLFRGSEFLNEDFRRLVQQLGINHKVTHKNFGNKVCLLRQILRACTYIVGLRLQAHGAERKVKTVRSVLLRMKAGEMGNNLYFLAKKVEDLLNRTPNSRSGLSPLETTDAKGPEKLRELRRERNALMKGVWIHAPKFKTGDIVRLSKRTDLGGAFRKAGEARFASELYRIIQVKKTRPRASYKIQYLNGAPLASKGFFPESDLIGATE